MIISQSCGSEINETKHHLITETVTYRNQTFDIVTIDPKKVEIQFFLADEYNQKYRSLKKLKQAIEKKGNKLLFAMNGGMYLKDGSPQGLYIENGKEVKALDTLSSGYGNFYMQPNGIFYLTEKSGNISTTDDFLKTNPKPKFATQSGPMLVINGQLHPQFSEGSKHLNIRNGVGINHQGKVVFTISNGKVNLYDFAMLFKEKLQCDNALYLDGFVSKAYIPQLKREQLDGNFGVMIGVVQKL